MTVNIRNTYFNVEYWASKTKSEFKKEHKGKFSSSELDDAWLKIKSSGKSA